MATPSKLNLNELASSIVKCFPSLSLLEQRLSLDLYRLLAEGQPVPHTTLAERLGVSVETVNRTLDGWPGVFSDAEGRIVGYWGLSTPGAYSSPHTLKMNGRTLSGWCAWDAIPAPARWAYGGHRVRQPRRNRDRAANDLAAKSGMSRTCHGANVRTRAGRPRDAKECRDLFLSFRPFLSVARSGGELGFQACGNLPAFDPRGTRSGASKERSAVPRRPAAEEGDSR